MARHPQPRRITLGGREAVALTLQEYEQLIASRRQIGGQSARIRVLAQQVKRDERLIAELTALVGGPMTASPEPDGAVGHQEAPACRLHAGTADESDPECLRCAITALLRRRHQDEMP
ncbi:hypothetical protein [Streptomyces sp. NPDC048650]|uniref:hypothetical protein n=1 Tax=unclassified Streptomyces TaxID=2593676 RepID=UPI00371439B3